MAKQGAVYRALNESINAAAEAGRLDKKAHAAIIAVSRKVARVMDDPDWPVIDRDAQGKGKLDNVSPSVLLRYCEAMGICPYLSADEKRAVKSNLSRLRDGMGVIRKVG